MLANKGDKPANLPLGIELEGFNEHTSRQRN
jgi:hypothetical protein